MNCYRARTSMNISSASCAAVSSPALSTCPMVASMSGVMDWNLSLSACDSRLCRQRHESSHGSESSSVRMLHMAAVRRGSVRDSSTRTAGLKNKRQNTTSLRALIADCTWMKAVAARIAASRTSTDSCARAPCSTCAAPREQQRHCLPLLENAL